MHADEVPTDVSLVERLVAAQFPQWAGLPVTPVGSAGTDNAIYRLGGELSVRLPRIRAATGQIELERRWLPRLAPHLPAAVPQPVAVGAPAPDYPFAWSVYRWLDGVNPTSPDGLAAPLARFIAALRGIDPADGPRARVGGRGGPLAAQNVDAPIAALAGSYDPAELAAAWHADAAAPPFDGAPVWFHGDLHGGNILVGGGGLRAVLDWSCLAVGDPAIDLIPAWTLLGPGEREEFRTLLGADEASWRRGRCWALTMALNALPYYRTTNPTLAELSRRIIAAILTEHGQRG